MVGSFFAFFDFRIGISGVSFIVPKSLFCFGVAMIASPEEFLRGPYVLPKTQSLDVFIIHTLDRWAKHTSSCD
jgi:hypothetical protein